MHRLPSIRRRLSRALLAWSLLFSLAIAAAVWLAARQEADELLDDGLKSASELLAGLLQGLPEPAPAAGLAALEAQGTQRFAWQLLGPEAQLLLRSPGAPATPWQIEQGYGFSHVQDWRVLATPLGKQGRVLVVAQSRAERLEAAAEVTLSTVLASLAVALLGHVWLRARLTHELAPLQALSARLAGHDPLPPGASLGPAAREELQPVHEAIDALGRRLARRLGSERAFSAHAAHALRTPLAGIDVQLAVALREAPPALQPRLQRVREATGRLQRVVVALLALFRSSEEPQLQCVDLGALFARLPVEGLRVEVAPDARLNADADLLSAALLNLLDNALRHGASRVRVSLPAPQTLRLQDDGAGVSPAQRHALLQGLQAQREGGSEGVDEKVSTLSGLGLLLADLVARSHGGALELPEVGTGFAVDLRLGA